MKVGKYEFTDELISAAINRMKSNPFTSGDIESELHRCGVPNYIGASYCRIFPVMRGADRLIQRERKAGNIKYENRQWTWIGDKEAS